MSFKNRIWRFIKKIANLNFSILILFFIILFIMFGSIIEQEKSLSYYQTIYPIKNHTFLPLNWYWITFFGIDHIYSTWWFLFTLIIFSCTLIVCTFSSQLPSLRNARQWRFLNNRIDNKSIDYAKSLTQNSLSNILYSLNIKNYYIFHKKDSVYAYKGLIGRIAPVFVHLGIIVTIFGFVLSLFGSFLVQEMVPVGEINHIKNVIKAGSSSSLPIKFFYKVNSFFITYYKDNSIRQFFSDLTIFNHKYQELIHKRVSVNFPLRFQGLTFYQTDWQMSALRIQIGYRQIIQRKLIKFQINQRSIWISILPLDSRQFLFLLASNLKDSIDIYDSSGHFLLSVNIRQNIKINNHIFNIDSILSSSGLQIKVDPGILFVYFGFSIVILSTFLSYISYFQIWINASNNTLFIIGSANRGILNFEEELLVIQQIYNQYTFSYRISDILS